MPVYRTSMIGQRRIMVLPFAFTYPLGRAKIVKGRREGLKIVGDI